MIAALYVEKGGVYYGLPDVDPWDKERDARLYAGPWPVVAHPPCERWGRFWYGSPMYAPEKRKQRGDDGGCFAAAIRAVRTFGGVLEHPADSSAWLEFGLRAPRRGGGWESAGDFLGWTCCVEQGHYGHRADKATWLYAVLCELPSLKWGKSNAPEVVSVSRKKVDARPAIKNKKDRRVTPIVFRDLLLDMARSVRMEQAA